jgi:signal transduction histidine kinase
LPVFFNQLRFIPFGSIFTLPLVAFTAYAIIRHHLLSVKVIATEILAFVLAVTNFFEVLLSDNGYDLIFRSIVFILILGLGVFLIKSVRKEVEQREEVALLADSLEKANLRLQELDKQKTEFLSIASHQLRTPLSILKGYIELIRDGAYGKIGPKMIPPLDNMDESNERLIHLIDEFLNISRIEQGRTKYTFAKAQINDTVTSVVDEQAGRAKDKGIKLAWQANSSLGQIVIDEEKVRHVIFNFVDNAIKYGEKGNVTVVAKRDDGGVRVTVTDQGLGFNKVDQANLYQKFYRGENVKGVNVGGTGLGLYVCRKFIEAHGGHVWAKSSGLGKGSEFGLWLPLSPPKELLEAAKPA